jgi:DNA-binding transcriptional LysR family regulator
MNAQHLAWDDIRHFLAVASQGTLSAAGEALGVDHSTVLRRIQGLEAELGARLFDRSQRGYAPTQLAEDLLPIARRIEDEMNTLARHAAGADQTLRGVVRVTTVGDWADVFSRYLDDFFLSYPGIRLEVELTAAVQNLSERRADVAIRAGFRKPSESDVVPLHVADLGFGLYASEAYLARHGRPRRLADVARKHRIVSGIGMAQQVTKVFFPDPPDDSSVYRTNDLTHALAAIRAGVGIGSLVCAVGEADPQLTRLFKPKKMGALWVLYHRDLRRNARVRAFVNFIVAALRADADLIEGRPRRG